MKKESGWHSEWNEISIGKRMKTRREHYEQIQEARTHQFSGFYLLQHQITSVRASCFSIREICFFFSLSLSFSRVPGNFIHGSPAIVACYLRRPFCPVDSSSGVRLYDAWLVASWNCIVTRLTGSGFYKEFGGGEEKEKKKEKEKNERTSDSPKFNLSRNILGSPRFAKRNSRNESVIFETEPTQLFLNADFVVRVVNRAFVFAGARAAAWIMDSPRHSIGTRRRPRSKVASNRSTSSPRVSQPSFNEFLLCK